MTIKKVDDLNAGIALVGTEDIPAIQSEVLVRITPAQLNTYIQAQLDLAAQLTWISKTANYTASSGNGVFVSTTGGVWTLKLPASPSVGDIVGVIDQDGTFHTNNLTVGRNSKNIMGIAEDMTVKRRYASFTMVYSGDATDGWRILR